MGGRLALTTGAAAEQAVALLLAEQGWQVLARNWRGAGGELDLVVQQRGRVRFVECVDGRKLARVRRAAEAWLQDYTDLVTEACLMVALVHGEPGDLRVHLFDDPD